MIYLGKPRHLMGRTTMQFRHPPAMPQPKPTHAKPRTPLGTPAPSS